MHLKKLQLTDFKNLHEINIELSEKINCFIGNNGAGKTNLLDAIYYLSFCKSYFNSIEEMNIMHGADFFSIHGTYHENDNVNTINCSLKKNYKKLFKFNKKEYDRLADHIGKIPLIIISPSDSNLIYSGSEERRKFFDAVISQFDKIYMDVLINYNKALNHRNALLKKFSETNRFVKADIEIWDKQLTELGNKIHIRRAGFIKEFMPLFQKYYEFITDKKEYVDITYDSHLNNNSFADLLDKSSAADRQAQYTTTGTHKDDFIFRINDYPVKKFGSQGQQKSFIISLKLAQFDYTKKMKKFKPLILFDDLYDKLDDLRINKIMELVSTNNFGQIFITDTNKNHIKETIEKLNIDYKIFEVETGQVNLTNS